MTAARKGRSWLVLLVSGIGMAILLSLSAWQYSKIAPKEAQIESIRSQMDLAPVALPDGALMQEDWAFRPAFAEGILRADAARHVYRAGPDGRPGYHLVMPLVRDSGPAIWVDMGWFFERDKAAFETPIVAKGPVRITGTMIPRQRSPKWITPAPPNPAENRYYRLQPEVLASGLGIESISAVYLLSKAPLEGLVATPIPFKLEHNHRSYAFQWLAMALGLAAITIAFLRRR
ncbi:MAG: SURF1 family protein [Pseudomonadota bacterium]